MQLRATRLTAIASAVKRAIKAFSPAQLFGTGAPGVWYDPSDFTTLFQDSAGTVPVTAVEQPVGLMLDKSQGLVLGSERKADFVTDIVGTATAATYNTTTGVGSLTRVDASNQSYVTLGSLSSGFYKTTISCQTGSIIIRAGAVTGTQQAALSAGQTLDVYVNTVNRISISHTTSAGSSTFTVVSVRELPGNHAFQATSASRPVLSARYNLLTKTEQFDDAAWTKGNVTVTPNATTAPDGTLTADKLVENTATGTHEIRQIVALNVTATELKIRAKPAGRTWIAVAVGSIRYAYFNLSGAGAVGTALNATGAISVDANGWYTCSITFTPAVAGGDNAYVYLASADNTVTYTGDGTSGVFVWGADLKPANQSTLPYQRVNTATDYATTGFLPYLKFDGVDDSLSTNSISFTSTDKMSVFAGVRKLSDAASGMLAELSADLSVNNGNFAMVAPSAAGANSYRFTSKGSLTAGDAGTGVFAVAPITNVLSGIGNISADQTILRVNGTQTASSTTDQGTGNYGNYPLYIGRRGGSSLPFNGQMYSMIIVGKAVTAGELSSTEAWVNSKTKAY